MLRLEISPCRRRRLSGECLWGVDRHGGVECVHACIGKWIGELGLACVSVSECMHARATVCEWQ